MLFIRASGYPSGSLLLLLLFLHLDPLEQELERFIVLGCDGGAAAAANDRAISAIIGTARPYRRDGSSEEKVADDSRPR